jgi:hypothetical protein
MRREETKTEKQKTNRRRRKNYTMVGSLQQQLTQACRAETTPPQIAALMPPSPSSANYRAGGVMSAMRQLLHAWNVVQNAA